MNERPDNHHDAIDSARRSAAGTYRDLSKKLESMERWNEGAEEFAAVFENVVEFREYDDDERLRQLLRSCDLLALFWRSAQIGIDALFDASVTGDAVEDSAIDFAAAQVARFADVVQSLDLTSRAMGIVLAEDGGAWPLDAESVAGAFAGPQDREDTDDDPPPSPADEGVLSEPRTCGPRPPAPAAE